MIDENKLKILTDGAKYDVSCSSSGSRRKNTPGGVGNASYGGICHSFTQDGRCISLLKILMTNDCVFDCKYCPNRHSADVPRAELTPEEICELTMGFYQRNYIEGLFLSSAVKGNPNETMQKLYDTVYLLRTKYHFNGYIHLKGIPHADKLLVEKACLLVDRMSYNVELPSEQSLKLLAPQKTKESVLSPISRLATKKRETALEFKGATGKTLRKGTGKFLPAGQTTQMIVGATKESDGQILKLTEALYRKFDLKRVYYSSYIPVVEDPILPDKPTGLLREHRLYQADWLLRFYGFEVNEILEEGENLPLEYDPKCAWAVKHPELFPVEVNRASLEELLRVPGIGTKGAYRILSARRYAKLTFEDLVKMRIVLKRAKHFITCQGKFIGLEKQESVKNSLIVAERTETDTQLSLFDNTLLTDAETRRILNGDSEKLTLLTATEKDRRFLLSSTTAIAKSVLTGEM